MLILMMLFAVDFSLNFEDLDMPLQSKAFLVGENYLFISSVHDALVLTNLKGDVIREYRKAGQGPEDVSVPRVIRMTQEHLWILNQNKRILVLDHQLNYVENFKAGPLGNLFRHGLHMNNRWFVLSTASALGDYLLFEFEANGKKAKKINRFFPQGEKVDMMKTIAALSLKHHQGFFFNYVPGVSDHYQIDVSQGLPQPEQNGKVLVTLAADISEYLPTYPGRTYQAYVGGIFKLEQGFVVDFSARTEPIGKRRSLDKFMDFFGEDGGFIKRAPLDVSLIGCENCPDVFIVQERGDADFVEKLQVPEGTF